MHVLRSVNARKPERRCEQWSK